jgi:hypothetical protein
LPRIEAPHDGCAECENHLDPWAGPQAPRLYEVPARPITRALLAVAGGRSYSAAAYQVRKATGIGPPERFIDRGGDGKTSTKRHGQLVGDWVEVYAPLLWANHAPTDWPDTVVLDSKKFEHRSKTMRPSDREFHVLVAVGYDTRRPTIVHIEAVPNADGVTWAAFLGELDGAPRRIVCDRGKELSKGLKLAQNAWATSLEVHHCEFHLAGNIREKFEPWLIKDETHPIHTLLNAAFTSLEAWDELCDALSKTPGTGSALHVARNMQTIVATQVPRRDPLGPNSNAAAEHALRLIGDRVRPRKHLYKNRARTTRMLQLLACDLNGWNDELTWNDLIRARLTGQQGRPTTDQRTVTDHGGRMSLRR